MGNICFLYLICSPMEILFKGLFFYCFALQFFSAHSVTELQPNITNGSLGIQGNSSTNHLDFVNLLYNATSNNATVRTKRPPNADELMLKYAHHRRTKDENSPKFAQSIYSLVIPETAEVNSTILRMKVTEQNATKYVPPIDYSLWGHNSNYFKINHSDGEITLAKALEFNKVNNYTLFVRATDAEGKYRIVTLLVNIKDVDTMNPYFTHPLYKASIMENHTGNLSTLPGKIKAIDGDIGIHDPVYYTISSVYPPEYSSAISINNENGVIYLNRKMDREKISLITVEIKATQESNNLKTADSVVLISIVDENDNPPQFSQSRYESCLPENSPPGSLVLVVTATDKDEGGFNGYFTILPEETPFQINNFGIITVKNSSALDRERTKAFHFQVWAYDAKINWMNASSLIIVNILDINDNNPEFHNQTLHFAIPEGDYRGIPYLKLGEVNVTDLDEGQNGQITIQSNAKDGDNIFHVQQNGTILVHGFLDRETKDRYILPLTASDNGIPPRKNFAEVQIIVKDINDNAPNFTQHEYFAHIIVSNVKKGDTVLTVSATDRDTGNNSRISYSFAGHYHNFNINETNGNISLSNDLSDVTKETSTELVVIAKDHGIPPLSSTVAVFITMTVNDTKFGLQFVNDIYRFSIAEDEPEGTEVGIVRALTGNKETTLTYFLKTYTDKFSITNQGHIITRVMLDQEKQDFYSIIVQACDSAEPPNTAATVVTVTVNDVNDNVPVFSPLIHSNITCPENKDVIDLGQIIATDKDTGRNGLVTYSLENDFNRTFHINNSSGKLTAIKPLDRERVDNYDLKVIAKDSGSQPLSSTIILHIIVQDVNDNPPVFNETAISITVKENKPPHVILNVSAVDRDTGYNALINYAFTTASTLFYIGERSGSISVLQPLDFETAKRHVFKVIAYNPENAQLHSTATITVIVEDVNEDAPTFEYPIYSKIIQDSSSYSGMVIVDINTTEENKGIHYSITDGNQEGLFVISNSTGHIFLIKDLPKHYKLVRYVLTVTATDKVGPPPSASVKVFVTIAPSNISFPVFSADSYIPEPISAQALPDTLLTQTSAFYSSKLTYNITKGNDKDYFSIDPLTGMIWTKRLLKKEDFPIELTVKAADSVRPSIFSNATVQVTVQEENLFSPVFTTSLVETTLKEEQNFPIFITQLQAFDNDTGRNGLLTYAILNGGPQNFSINPTNGKIFADATFDYEDGPIEYQIFVVAEDDGEPVRKQGYCSVVIHIVDINDCEPVFEPVDDVLVEENAPVGTIVGKVTATDRDSGDNAFILYSLFDKNDQFDIDGVLGNIFVKQCLDYETSKGSVLTVRATNNKTAPFFETNTQVTVIVLDTNDNAPEFTQNQYFAEINMNSPSGTLVVAVNATDRDQGDNGLIEYFLLPNSVFPNCFLIENVRDGKIVTTGNHLMPGEVNLTVLAKDRGSPPLNSTAVIIVNVVNKQPSVPELNPNEITTTLKKTERGKHLVYTFSAKPHPGKNIIYMIGAGNELGKFILDSKTGQLWTTDKLNYGMQQSYTITVEAIEFPEIQLTGLLPKNVAQIKIFLENVNEGPVFEKKLYNARVLNSVPYKFPVIRVTAKEPGLKENGSLTYSLVDQSGKTFDIDKHTGQIFVVSVAGKTGLFSFKAQATDHSDLSDQTTVQITVNSKDSSSSSSNDEVELRINQTLDKIQHQLPNIIRILEDTLHQDVIIIDLFSNATKKESEKEGEKTSIRFQAVDKYNQVVHAGKVLRKLTDNISSIQKSLSRVLGTPVEVSVPEPPKLSIGQDTVTAGAVGAVLGSGLLGFVIYALKRKKSEKSPQESDNIVVRAIDHFQEEDNKGGPGDVEKNKDTLFPGITDVVRIAEKVLGDSGNGNKEENMLLDTSTLIPGITDVVQRTAKVLGDSGNGNKEENVMLDTSTLIPGITDVVRRTAKVLGDSGNGNKEENVMLGTSTLIPGITDVVRRTAKILGDSGNGNKEENVMLDTSTLIPGITDVVRRTAKVLGDSGNGNKEENVMLDTSTLIPGITDVVRRTAKVLGDSGNGNKEENVLLDTSTLIPGITDVQRTAKVLGDSGNGNKEENVLLDTSNVQVHDTTTKKATTAEQPKDQLSTENSERADWNITLLQDSNVQVLDIDSEKTTEEQPKDEVRITNPEESNQNISPLQESGVQISDPCIIPAVSHPEEKDKTTQKEPIVEETQEKEYEYVESWESYESSDDSDKETSTTMKGSDKPESPLTAATDRTVDDKPKK